MAAINQLFMACSPEQKHPQRGLQEVAGQGGLEIGRRQRPQKFRGSVRLSIRLTPPTRQLFDAHGLGIRFVEKVDALHNPPQLERLLNAACAAAYILYSPSLARA
jgi:hypothetical protein